MKVIVRIAYAFLYLAGSRRRLEAGPPERFARTAWAMVLLAMAWGLLLAGIWDLTYHLTWARRLDWVVPAALCGAAIVLGPFRPAAAALLGTVLPNRWWLTWPALAALAALAALMLNHAVRYWDPDWPRQLPPAWGWLWPRALYRVLLLMPLWGVWGMLGVGQFHRPGERTDAPTRRLAETTGPLTAAIALALPLAGSFIYLMFLWTPMRFAPPAAAILAALGGGSAICRLKGGLCREALLATNLLTQLAFLAAYLAVR